jgi:hypothetical protein
MCKPVMSGKALRESSASEVMNCPGIVMFISFVQQVMTLPIIAQRFLPICLHSSSKAEDGMKRQKNGTNNQQENL